MAEIKYETEEKTIEVGGVPIPESVRDKLISDGQAQTVASIRRKSQDRLSGVFEDDFNWHDAKPAEIIETLSRIIVDKEKVMSELQSKKPDKTVKDEPNNEHIEELRKLKDMLNQQNSKHQDEIAAERNRNISQESLNEIKSHLITNGLNEDQQPLFKSMIDTHFDSSVENGNVVFRQKGTDADYYIDGKLATPKDISKFITDKFPGSFSNVQAGAGTGRTAQVLSGGVNGSGMERLKSVGIRRMEEQVWE